MGLIADVNALTEITKSETTKRSSGSPENEGLTLLRHHSWIVCATQHAEPFSHACTCAVQTLLGARGRSSRAERYESDQYAEYGREPAPFQTKRNS